ncbi:MAG: S-methyl-5-thioribose-1-phosphate isomerase [Candidatus Cloacimonetes bacterium]|nr:S-methyl-5-thioribose-1-phosphate isomerase [Candidatus Cloacimonadota bacterium]
MKVNGKNYRTIWMEGSSVFLIEQNLLPFKFEIHEAKTYKQTCTAIRDMLVRGAGAIGTSAGFALAQAFLEAPEKGFWKFVENAKKEIEATRPTARNLFYATEKVFQKAKTSNNPVETAIKTAQAIADKDAEDSRKIGEYGNDLIKSNYKILTHCNAGWLAFTDFGTALSPIYKAHQEKKNIFVYVDETRPRSQGALLTAWELKNEGIPHAIIPDNAAAHLMSQGKINMVIVGADRIAANGDVANKIGTLEKAICANEYGIPFYVAAPTSTFDLNCKSGKDITIEERSPDEVLYQTGLTKDGKVEKVLVCSPGSNAFNPAFDVTPAKFITGIITEKGIIPSQEEIYQGVKFQTVFEKKQAPRNKRIENLKYWCRIFHKKNLAPPYPEGSFGNMSFRIKEGKNRFIITGSRIGLKNSLTNNSFVEVVNCDFENKTIYVNGTREPSSESMLHFAIYKIRPDINAIFHGHCAELLENASKLEIPTTFKEEPYGTIELVNSVLEIIDKNNFIIMKNHGFITIGKTMKEAGIITEKYYEKCKRK